MDERRSALHELPAAAVRLMWVLGLLLTGLGLWLQFKVWIDPMPGGFRTFGSLWVRLISGALWSLPLLAGLALLFNAWSRRRLRGLHGAALSQRPVPAVCGRPFTVVLDLPATAEPGPWRLQLVQRLVDRSGSWADSSIPWQHELTALATRQPDGRLRVQATLQAPANAPGSNFYRDMQHVDWELRTLDGQGKVLLKFQLQLKADDGQLSPLGEPLFVERPLPATGADAAMAKATLPSAWRERETEGGYELHFPRPFARFGAVLAALAAVALAVALAWPWWTHGHRLPLDGDAPQQLIGLILLLPLLMHLATVRWRLLVDDDGIEVDRSSWLWLRRWRLGGAALDQLAEVVVSAGHADHRKSRPSTARDTWRRLVIGGEVGARHWLTPAINGPGRVRALAARLRRALGHRGARFAPGQRRRRTAVLPLVRAVLLWAGWALVTVVGGLRLLVPGVAA